MDYLHIGWNINMSWYSVTSAVSVWNPNETRFIFCVYSVFYNATYISSDMKCSLFPIMTSGSCAVLSVAIAPLNFTDANKMHFNAFWKIPVVLSARNYDWDIWIPREHRTENFGSFRSLEDCLEITSASHKIVVDVSIAQVNKPDGV